MNCGYQPGKGKNIQKLTPELIQHLNEWIGNHPQVVNSQISNDTTRKENQGF